VSQPLAMRGIAGVLDAAKNLPAATGETARYQTRLASGSSAGGSLILADVSSSMAESAGEGIRKIDVLRDALAMADGATLIAFSSIPRLVPGAAELPAPHGGTALHLALDMAAPCQPQRTLVISDGCPDSKDLAFAAAARLSGVIDVIYCGPDTDFEARAFMIALARAGCGRYAAHDIGVQPRALSAAVRGFLGAGRP